MYRNLLISTAKSQFGIDIDDEMMDQIEKISELVDALMINSQQKKSKYQQDKGKSLQNQIRTLGKELMREVYGYYNTETGSNLSSTDRKLID
jgi:hypothetical protein